MSTRLIQQRPRFSISIIGPPHNYIYIYTYITRALQLFQLQWVCSCSSTCSCILLRAHTWAPKFERWNLWRYTFHVGRLIDLSPRVCRSFVYWLRACNYRTRANFTKKSREKRDAWTSPERISPVMALIFIKIASIGDR